MVLLSYMTGNAALCVAILSISFGFNGAIYAGHSTNGLTIAPNRYNDKIEKTYYFDTPNYIKMKARTSLNLLI
jgi:hypothetical protein